MIERLEDYIIKHSSQLYPDNVIVVVDKLREYSRLNRIYANDELYTTEKLQELLFQVPYEPE